MQSAIQYPFDDPKFSKDNNLASFNIVVKNKAQYGVFIFKQLPNKMFWEPKDVVTPPIKKKLKIFIWWDPTTGGLSKQRIKV